MAETFAHLTGTGPLLVAVAVAALAGLVSFLSPCVLPLVPGYVSYVAGMAGADLDAALGTDPHGRPVTRAAADEPGAGGVATLSRRAVRGRVLVGSLLFIAGFTAVFVTASVVVARVGRLMVAHARALEIVVGVLVIVLGLGFAGLLPGLRGEARIHALPRAGLVGAPILGAVFALSWTPCVGPTLGTVLTLSAVSGQTSRAVTLAVAYCLGLGLPFLAFGLGLRKLLGVFAAVRRHSVWVTRIGGALLVIVGLALVTGGWGDFLNWLRATVGAGTVSI
ncbi:MAG TPA: cytochrome c biogenesis protein CcdA [Micromonosporaceae bacterium]